MKLTIVGNRGGQAVIHWPGVFLAAVSMAAALSLGVVALSLVLGSFSPASFAMLPLIVAVIIGMGIRRGLQLPPEALPALG